MTDLTKGVVKTTVVAGALVSSYVIGEHIERVVLEDDNIDAAKKPTVTVVGCLLSGSIIRLIARCIVKRI